MINFSTTIRPVVTLATEDFSLYSGARREAIADSREEPLPKSRNYTDGMSTVPKHFKQFRSGDKSFIDSYKYASN